MKKFFFLMLAIASLNLTSCGYDDDEVWNAINDQENRIAALENWQKTANENIAALQALVNGNDYITAVTPITENGETIGYTISFVKQGDIKIYHGKKGDKGDTGDKGEQGDKGETGNKGEAGIAGSTPAISLTQQSDGKWYWTLNGELMKDDQGNPICASGKDGADGSNGSSGSSGSSAPIPQLKTGSELGADKIQDAIYLSVDGGQTWTKVSGTDGTDGDNGIGVKDVTENSNSWSFVMSDGTTINVPKFTKLTLTYKNGESEEIIKNGELSVNLNSTFSIQCEVAEGYTWSYEVMKNDPAWSITPNNNNNSLTFNANAVGSVTIVFILAAEDNQAFFYKVTISTKIIKGNENPALVSALKTLLNVPSNEQDIVITQDLVETTTTLDFSSTASTEKITSIEGLEGFTNLETLNLSGNNITKVEGLENCSNLTTLNLSGNQITNVEELTNCENLESLNISNNPISNVEEVKETLSQLPKLTYLDCSSCFIAPSTRAALDNVLDLSNCNTLLYLDCSKNELTQLIVSTHSELHTLIANHNELTHIDVSQNTALKVLELDYNQLTGINTSKNTELQSLRVLENSAITSLDVSQNKALYNLVCNFCSITSLDLSNNLNLESLFCGYNQLKTLDVSKNTKLDFIYCQGQKDASGNNQKLTLTLNENQLTKWNEEWKNENPENVAIDGQEEVLPEILITNTALIEAIEASIGQTFVKNDKEEVDINKNQELVASITDLNIRNKNLSSIEGIEHFKNLTSLNCGNNPLVSLKFPLMPQLDVLWCDSTQLNSLDVTSLVNLGALNCSANKLSSLDLSACTELATLYCWDNQLTSLSSISSTILSALQFQNNSITELNIEKFTELVDLNCSYNPLTNGINVENCPNLSNFYCNGIGLTEINVSKNPKLSMLYCGENPISKLDVSGNTQLTWLVCDGCNLTSLDISNNLELELFNCSVNQLTTLDISKNLKLNDISCGKQQDEKGNDQQLTMTIDDSQLTLWETVWGLSEWNSNIKIPGHEPSSSNSSADNFTNGGSY